MPLRTFKVMVLHSDSGADATLRVLKVAAPNKREATVIATDMLLRLSPDQLQSITLDAQDADEVIEDVEIVDVYDMRYDIPGHVWTREQVEEDDLKELVAKAAATLNAGTYR